MAARGACDGAFVVVGAEVADGADIADAVCVLRGKGQGGEESDIRGVGEVRAEKVGISGSEGASQVGGHHLQSGAGLAVGLDFFFGCPPEACGALNDIEEDDEEDGKNGYGDKKFQ